MNHDPMSQARNPFERSENAWQLAYQVWHFGMARHYCRGFHFANVRLAVAAIAQHVLSLNAKPTLLVAGDRRFFSEEFVRTAAIVLTAHGVHPLVCTGATPTPTVAYEVRRRKVDGAINFTASHNPFDYHGLKFSGPDGAPALEDHARHRSTRRRSGAEESPRDRPFLQRTIRTILKQIDPAPAYLARLGELIRFDTIVIGRERRDRRVKHGLRRPARVWRRISGSRAGRPRDPGAHDTRESGRAVRRHRARRFGENLAPLAAAMAEQKAHIGLATDGDADRFGIADGEGNWISPNHILGLLYDYLLESRGWKLGAGRSVATTQLLDAVAKKRASRFTRRPWDSNISAS